MYVRVNFDLLTHRNAKTFAKKHIWPKALIFSMMTFYGHLLLCGFPSQDKLIRDLFGGLAKNEYFCTRKNAEFEGAVFARVLKGKKWRIICELFESTEPIDNKEVKQIREV